MILTIINESEDLPILYYILFLLLLITINDEDIESIGAHTQEGVKCVCVLYPSWIASLIDSIIYGAA